MAAAVSLPWFLPSYNSTVSVCVCPQCSYAVLDSVDDDQLVAAINGQVVYNKTGAGGKAPNKIACI